VLPLADLDVALAAERFRRARVITLAVVVALSGLLALGGVIAAIAAIAS
jgi:hypothetical protein